jgi:hypothetical protein
MYDSARCLSVVRLYAFPPRKLDTIIETNPRLAVLLCRQITANEGRAHDHLTNLGLHGGRERIAHLLLEIYVRLRRRLSAEPGDIIQLPLSQGHIGQAAGLTHFHVCRTLQILREQKILRFANHRLEIIDPPALIAAAGIEYDMFDHPRRSTQSSSASSDRDAAGSLPAAWMPVQNDRTVFSALASASAGRAFIAAKAA